jgi:pterin-4a-carbinolamine dehydratase
MTTDDSWQTHGGALVREFEFRDSDEAKAFAELVADQAVDYHRRPELTLSSNLVRIAIPNLHHLPPTLAERRLARKVDAIVAGRPPAR